MCAASWDFLYDTFLVGDWQRSGCDWRKEKKKAFTMWRDTTLGSLQNNKPFHFFGGMASVCSSVMNSRSRCGGFGWRRCRGCGGGHGGLSSFRCRWGRSLGRGDLDLLPVLPFLHHEGDENAQAHVATALLHLERGREQHSHSQRSSFRKPSLKFEFFNFYWKFSSAWH